MGEEAGFQRTAAAAAGIGEQQPAAAILPNGLNLAGLPAPWFAALITQHLGPQELLALFSTCRTMASLVVQHCNGLTLMPVASLKANSSRRAAVYGLAASCNNVHVHLKGDSPALDLDHFLPCITQLTLCDVPRTALNPQNIRLEHLSHLHTLSINSELDQIFKGGGVLDVHNLKSVVQAGGLPSLHVLRSLHEDYGHAYHAVLSLAPILGSQITQLVLGGRTCVAITKLGVWPALRHITVQPAEHHDWHRSALVEIVEHPTLTHITLHGKGVHGNNAPITTTRQWEVLQFCSPAHDDLLTSLPLQQAQLVQLVQGVWILENADDAAAKLLQHLCQCRALQLISAPAQDNRVSGLDAELPIFTIGGFVDRELLSWLSERVQGNALKLAAADGMHYFAASLSHICHIAPHIHTLVLSDWTLGGDCVWADVFDHVPSHVSHLILSGCFVTHEGLKTAFQRSGPPAGLRKLTLAIQTSSNNFAYWAFSAQHVGPVKALAAQLWPSVQLDVIGLWHQAT